MIRFFSVLTLLLACTQGTHADTAHKVAAKATAVYSHNNSESWLDGGTGRFNAGSDKNGRNNDVLGDVELGYKYTHSKQFSVFTHTQLRYGTDQNAGDEAGFVEFYAKYEPPLSEQQKLTVMLGQFFLPT